MTPTHRRRRVRACTPAKRRLLLLSGPPLVKAVVVLGPNFRLAHEKAQHHVENQACLFPLLLLA